MRPMTVSQTGAGNSLPIPFDVYGRPEVALQVNVTGTVNYTVQQTLDDPAGASPTWFSHPDAALVGATASAQGNYAYVPRAARVVVNSGTGTAQLVALQAGLAGA